MDSQYLSQHWQRKFFQKKTLSEMLLKGKSAVITGCSKDVIKELPFEFSLEASQLLKVSLEGAV